MQSQTFLRTWAVSLAGFGVLIVAFNLLIDPYDVFGVPRISGISATKPAAKNHAMLAKTYQVVRARPVTVLIGSSSTHIGIDATSQLWPAAMRPVYNYGIPGNYATSTGLGTLQEAVTTGSVKNAVVFLDFQNFFIPEQRRNDVGEDERRFHARPDGSPNPLRPEQTASDMFLSLATMGALVDSLTTVVGQARANTLNLTPDGSSTEADFIAAAGLDGMHDLFAQKDDYELERATRLKQTLAGWEGPLPGLDIVASLIAFARSHDIRLTLVITPHHADALEIYWRLGLWPRVEQLKTELAGVAATGSVTLWDFMDYSRFTTEAVPAAGDRRRATSWFWEPTHFKKQLGEIMIDGMFGTGAPAFDAPVFGTILTPANVAVRNRAIRAERQAVVCEGSGEPLLTALTARIAAGCNSGQAGGT